MAATCPSISRVFFFRSLFSAPLPYSSRLSPLSECLEQAMVTSVPKSLLSAFAGTQNAPVKVRGRY